MQGLFESDEPSKPVSHACAFLGLDGDPDTRALIVTASHRCFASGTGMTIDPAHQRRFCLTAEHQTCPILTAGPRPEPQQRRVTARPATGLRNRFVVSTVAGAVVAAIVGAALIFSSATDEAANGDALVELTRVAPETATAAPSVTKVPAAQIATQAPSPTSAPSTATPAPPSPTPTPPAPTEHIVQSGETLSGIAAQNGLSVEALAAANGIPATTLLFAGDTLVIPPVSALQPAP
jgi:LysM repeat protein